VIKYLGSKRLLLPNILACIEALQPGGSVLDLFSGTSRVAHALKKAGHFVTANDHLAYAYTLAACYVQADARKYRDKATKLIDELQMVPPKPGYFTEAFCMRSRYFQPKNGEKIDAIREAIASMRLEPEMEAIAVVSLMEAADRVDSTAGIQMAYLKTWSDRSYNDVVLRVPNIVVGPGQASQLDAIEAAQRFPCDVAYLDPPYNQHSYMGNYHVWESLVRWDKPDTYGVACKRVQCKEYSSAFNSKRRAAGALRNVIGSLQCKHIVVSFNNEGFIDQAEMEGMLAGFGYVIAVPFDYKRYVGAQIGIYNPSGEKVGQVSHTRNREILYVVSPSRATAEIAAKAAIDA
jgi:adenine-specific DNA-methyltransferase